MSTASNKPGSHYPQIVRTGAGDFVFLAKAEYDRLCEAARRLEDTQDAADAKATLGALRTGETESLPLDMIKRLSAGAHPVRVWRAHRGLSLSALAERVGVSQPFLSNVENGKKNASFEVMAAIAAALGVTLDELNPWRRS